MVGKMNFPFEMVPFCTGHLGTQQHKAFNCTFCTLRNWIWEVLDGFGRCDSHRNTTELKSLDESMSPWQAPRFILLMVQKSSDHQLILVLYPSHYLQGFSTIPGGFLARFLNHHPHVGFSTHLPRSKGQVWPHGDSLQVARFQQQKMDENKPWGEYLDHQQHHYRQQQHQYQPHQSSSLKHQKSSITHHLQSSSSKLDCSGPSKLNKHVEFSSHPFFWTAAATNTFHTATSSGGWHCGNGIAVVHQSDSAAFAASWWYLQRRPEQKKQPQSHTRERWILVWFAALEGLLLLLLLLLLLVLVVVVVVVVVSLGGSSLEVAKLVTQGSE